MKVCVVILTFIFMGCTHHTVALNQAGIAFNDARYADVQVWLRDVEHQIHQMQNDDVVRFYFLRGMTEYRIGYLDQAMYDLSIAREVDDLGEGVLEEQDRRILDQALERLTPPTATWHANQ